MARRLSFYVLFWLRWSGDRNCSWSKVRVRVVAKYTSTKQNVSSTSGSKRRTKPSKAPARAIRSSLRGLYDPKADHRNLLVGLKYGSPETFSEIIRLALQIPTPRRLLLGDPFPQTFSTLCTHVPLRSTGSLIRELFWATEIIVQFSKQLNNFLTVSRRIEKYLLLADFNSARAALLELTVSLGWSLWAIQSQLLLADLEGGISGNRAKLVEFFKTADPLLQALAYFFSLRAEGSSSAASYDAAISNYLSRTDPSAQHDLWSYFRLQVDFHQISSYDETTLAAALAESARGSIIDRYLLLLRLLQVVLSVPFSKDLQALAGFLANRLGAAIEDPRLLAINLLSGGTGLTDQWRRLNMSLLLGIDEYTLGNYHKAAEQGIREIHKDPSYFGPYELWARSTLHSFEKPSELKNLAPVSRDIASLVRRVLNRSRDAEESLQQILKIAYRLDHLRIGSELFAFYLEHRLPKHPLNSRRFAESSSSILTPRFALALNSPSESLAFIDKFDGVAPTSSTTNLFREILQQITERRPCAFSLPLPIERRLKYEALVLEQSQLHRDAVRTYTELANLTPAAAMVRMDAAVGLYNCLLELGEIDRCIELVVDTYISEDNLLAPTQVSSLVQRCQETPNLHSISDPALPILYHIHKQEGARGGDVDPVYVAYDRFLSEVGLSRPSDLQDRLSDFNSDRIRFFLRYICIPEVMDSSINYATTEDLEDERIKICQLLREIDAINEDIYAEEISLLQKRAALRGAIRSANRSKIYIDTAAIEGSLDARLRELFERFRTIARLDPSRRQLLPQSLASARDVFVVSDESVEMHRKLFEELRNRFISSDEHGLDSYLSVRVRHGTLAGQIRNTFERYHLATRSDSVTGSYEANDYWTSTGQLQHPFTSHYLNEILAEFSATIDAIIEDVKGNWVQLRSGDLKDAYFDYEFSEEDIGMLYARTLEVDDFEVFTEIVFDVLWTRTEENLRRLRDAITVVLGERLTAALDTLREKVEELGDIPPSLLSDIASCRTAIQNELQIIAGWFVVERDGAPDDFDVTLAIDSSIEIVRKTFPLDCGSVESKAEYGLQLKGRVFPHLLDLLYILMENVIKHSRPEKVGSIVSVGQIENKLWIKVENSLRSGTDLVQLANRIPELQARVGEVGAHERIRREGGTGFYKLGKILQHDLKAAKWRFDISIGENRTFAVRVEMDLEGIGA